MAPSPELGQPKPKVPDKVDTEQRSIDEIGEIGEIDNDTDCEISTNSKELDTKNLSNLDDNSLKNLLEEAFTYKSPKDRIHKSVKFNELLTFTEQEDKALRNSSPFFIFSPFRTSSPVRISNPRISSRVRRSNCRSQGGSLQDLVDKVERDQLLESDLRYNRSSRKHNSRRKKYSSVSTRQREGGSLPSNVNCSSYEDHFTYDFGERGIKNETILMSDTDKWRQDGEVSQSDEKVNHTVIEIGDGDIDETCHLLAHDSLAQDPQSSDEGTELNQMKKIPRLGMNFSGHQYNVDMMSDVARIDKTVQFNSLKSGSKTNINAIQLNDSYVAVNSCIDSKSMVGGISMGHSNSKFSTYHHPHNIHLIEQKNTDENGNAVQTFNSTLQSSGQVAKKDGKKKKMERNIKSTIAAKDIEGNRGDESIEALVSFIENTDTRKNGVISNNVSKTVLPLDKKGKKSSADNKKDNSGNNKLKKYNSMENLKSTSKLEEENAQSENIRESAVVLRHKQQMKKAAEMKENNKQQHQKRGERRSWGTEELTYLGDTSSIEKRANSGDNEPKELRKTKDYQKVNRKKDEHSESMVSSESISALNETAEFHVVTKKKKPKKKQEEMRQKQAYHSPGQHAHTHGNRLRYQTSHNYSNDREVYLTPFNASVKRRKSTSSSMPPSEKSDCSDLDSVHSLPIESTSRTNNNVQSAPTPTGNSTPPASYAEIARISQQNKQSILATSLDKWPTVSSAKNPESPDNSNMSTCSTLSAKSQSSVRGNKFFPDTNDVSNAIHDIVSTHSTSTASNNNTTSKAISYSQSLTEDKQQKSFDASNTNEEVIKRQTNSVTTNKYDLAVKMTNDTTQKNPLQKSKSVDNDNYTNMNIDHYPALEKTVKPQKQYQSMPAVQTNHVNANQINIAISSTKPTPKSTKLSSQSQPTTVVKSNDPSPTNPSKKGKSALTNQTTLKNKNLSDTSSEFALNQIDEAKIVKSTQPSVEMCDVSFGNMMLPPPTLHSTSTTKKSVKREKSIHQTATQNHLNYDRNRPAVIILDNNNKYGHNVSPLLFGDFNEEEVAQWDQDSDLPFIMSTNHHFDQTNQASLPIKATIQSIIAEPVAITNDKPLSPQTDLGYSSSYSRNTTQFSCDVSPDHSITSVDQPVDLASDHMQKNRCSSSCSSSTGQDQLNNNSVPKVNNNTCSSSINLIHAKDEIIMKQPINSIVPTGREKMTLVCDGELKLKYIEPAISNLDNYNHDKIVDFIGLAWEDAKYGRAEFYNGQ